MMSASEPLTTEAATSSVAPMATRRQVWLFRIAVCVPAIIQTFMWREKLDADGMSYIDVAHAYAAGNFNGAINGYWSPLYSWLIAAMIKVFPLSNRGELAAIHVLNFLLFLVALAAFDFFLRELFQRLSACLRTERAIPWSPWTAFAYSAFALACTALQDVGRGGPDFILAASFYATIALLFAIYRSARGVLAQAFSLGLVLGVGYLAKAVMLWVAVPVIASAVLLWWRLPRRLGAILLMMAGLALTAVPWIAVLSSSKGRLTWGDTGRLNYAWYVDETALFHWRGDPVHGAPLHTPRLLSDSVAPRVFALASPLPATYPIWYDPSYWYEGLHVRPHLRNQLRRWSLSAADVASQLWFAPVVVALVTLGLAAGKSGRRRALHAVWFVILTTATGIALYFQVLILNRHIAPFFVAGATAIIVALAFAIEQRRDAVDVSYDPLAWGIAVVFGLMSLNHLVYVDRPVSLSFSSFGVAAKLEAAGIGPESPIAVIGDSMHAYWAQAARNRIVAEIFVEEAPAFWAQDYGRRAELLAALASTGAVGVVADKVPSWADTAGWSRIPGTPYFFQRFR